MRKYFYGASILSLFVILYQILYRQIFSSISNQSLQNNKIYTYAENNKIYTYGENPCEKLNDTELFLRTFHKRKFLYKYVFQKSLSVFWACRDQLKLVVVLDNESEDDHIWGEELKKEFPYPRVMYEDPFPDIYHNDGHIRQQYTMFNAEKYTNATFVGFVDSDTLFTTVVTPGILFESGKPTVIGRIGIGGPHWDTMAYRNEKWFDHKEVMIGMSYFPVVMKVDHLVQLRRTLEEKHTATFNEIFKKLTVGDKFSQFTIMCQFVWMFHRDDYSFHFEPIPNDEYNYRKVPKARAPPSYYKENLKIEHWLPKPRSSIHWSYPQPNPPSVAMLSEVWMELIIREGFCYSIGIKYCPSKCIGHYSERIQEHIYIFEGVSWAWHGLALQQQKLHYKEVHHLILYLNRTKKGVLGFHSIKEACKQWPKGYNFIYPQGKVLTRHFKGKH